MTIAAKKTGLVPKRLASIVPSPENEAIYRPVRPDDPEIEALAESIRQHGLREPIVVTRDGFILSGHRRHAACLLAGLRTALVRVEPFRRRDDPDRFIRLLREYNRQREKNLAEKVREELIDADPTESHRRLVEHRRAKARTYDEFSIVGQCRRSDISDAKIPFLDAIRKVLRDRSAFLPLTVRAVHYALLNDPPLRHASKPDSAYGNDKASYKSLDELITRARICGEIAMSAIHDPTRPVTVWDVHQSPRSFVRRSVDEFLKGYYRDLMQSQPNHIECIGEKNTVDPILRDVLCDYCIPLTTGRGFASLPPRAAIAKRFADSGKEKLVLLIVSDHDPDGEEICQSLPRSMRDDFGVEAIAPIRVALTHEQVTLLRLPRSLDAKKSSANFAKFREKYGENAYELESLQPADLQQLLRDAIDSVLDLGAFRREIEEEKKDAAALEALRRSVHQSVKDLHID